MPIISVKNLGKKYQIRHNTGRYIALRDVVAGALRHPLRFLQTKAKQFVQGNGKEEYWALKDLNFEIEKGEVVGIIGANGAGKSTLLKILSQITPPTTGEIRIEGRVASMLEVGTGFHPELTGRENIFLNGAILGMTKAEIAEKFDAIVEFSGLEKFLDTPVRFYSSGMYMRLAFSVAAHLEPDILIIDEVLAVGDAEFQKKCLLKMDQIAKEKGRTILFVSHNLVAIENLCQRVFVLAAGQLISDGTPHESIAAYQEKCLNSDAVGNLHGGIESAVIGVKEVKIIDEDNQKISKISVNDPLNIALSLAVHSREPLDVEVALGVMAENGTVCYWFISNENGNTLPAFASGEQMIVMSLEKHSLVPGIYSMFCTIRNKMTNETYYKKLNIIQFAVFDEERRIFRALMNEREKWQLI